MFTHPYRYLFIAILTAYTYLNTVLCEVYHYFHIEIEWYYALLTIGVITFGIWEGNRLIEPMFEKRMRKSNHKFNILLFFFFAGCFFTTIFTTGIVFFMSMGLHQHTLSETLVPLKLNLIYAWLANLLFHLLNALLFYFTEYKTKLIEAQDLKRMTAIAELQVVKSQINPHFLFNNLNVLSALVMQNNNEANRFIEAFSKVFRYILNVHEEELVELGTELNFIKPYVFLLEKRFTEGLHITFNIAPEKENHFIIPASLQMLIENAIKHNIVSKHKPLHIDVHTNGNNTLVVTNNLQLRDSVDSSTKIGLNNITKRYQLASGKLVEVYKDQATFSVSLPLLTLN